MAEFIPFIPGDTNYRLAVPLNDGEYLFDVRWNERDQAHYVDIRLSNEEVIVLGAKVVLGGRLGQLSTHAFFDAHVLQPIDMSGEGLDARFDDLGQRVQVVHMTMSEFKGQDR